MPNLIPQAKVKRLLASSAGKQPESLILTQVRDYLRLKGWLVFRHQQGLGAHKGFPDLTAIRNGETIYVEVKTPRGKLSEHQEKFQAQVEAAGCRYIVARGIEDLEEAGL